MNPNTIKTSNNIEVFEFEIHYHIEPDGCHIMDARIHNMAELYLLKSIFEIQKYIGNRISISVEAKQSGGIRDSLLVHLEKRLSFAAGALFVAFANICFRPAIHKTEEIKNLVDIATAIKSGNFSNEEASALIDGDKRLKHWRSKYFKTIAQEASISKIEASIPAFNNTNTIERKDFSGHIISEKEVISSEIIEGAKIYIVSPVLIKGKGLSWKGVYMDNPPIDFKIEDNEFLSQVYNGEIKFGNGTAIVGNLQIETVIDENDKNKKYYIVKSISQWTDENNISFDTKKKRKDILFSKQTSLIDDSLFYQ